MTTKTKSKTTFEFYRATQSDGEHVEIIISGAKQHEIANAAEMALKVLVENVHDDEA